MFSTIRKRLTYANVAMTLALVFAMTGGAYAAHKYLITSTKQISPKVLRQLKGAEGPAGAAGAQGPQGPAGANGKDGANGTNGTNGKDGAPGTSVTSKVVPTGVLACGEQGGSEFKIGTGTPTYACNGQNGQSGFTETLPSGNTETGVWAVAPSAEGIVFVPISFNIPLAAALGESHVFFVGENGNGAQCPGKTAKPTATAGNLCVYRGKGAINLFNMNFTAIETFSGPKPGADTSGALLSFEAESGAPRIGYGVWAVTAE